MALIRVTKLTFKLKFKVFKNQPFLRLELEGVYNRLSFTRWNFFLILSFN